MGFTLLVLVPRYNQAVISFYFVCLFVCLFVVVVQFYKNRENSYLDSGMRADWWKILFLVSSVCQGLDAWDIFPQDGW